MFMYAAMPPNNAAAPTAAVLMGAASVLLEVVWTAPPPLPAPVSVATGGVVEGASTPLVKGLLPSVAVLAPE